VTRAQAQAEISGIADRLQAEYPSSNRGRGITLQPLWRSPFNPMEALVPTLTIALIVVAAVLLIACANVGNLLLLRSVARRREMTIRLAVGATRWRIVRQLLTEAVILSALAGAGGLLVAFWARDGLVLLFPPRGATALRLPAELDWRVLALAIGVCLTSTVIFGLVPAILGSDVDLIGSLKSESASVVGRSGKAGVRSGLVALQVALSFVLLVGALLVVQSLQRMRSASPGFGADRVLASGVDLVSAGYDDRRANVFMDRMIDRLEALPGVESAAFVRVTPFAYVGYSSAPIAVGGYDVQPGEPPTVDYDEIGPSYLRTIGIPLVRGREFSRDDDESSEAVAVVNEAMAARFWDGRDPVGSELRVNGRTVRVIGIAKMAKYRNLQEPARPFFYLPLRQTGARAQAFVIRSPLDSGTMAAALAREIRALDSTLVPAQVISMREQMNRTMSSESMVVTLLTAFGALAVLLAAIGLYGVMSFTVSQASGELALRVALGAAPSTLLGAVLRAGLVLSGAGAAAALGLTRLLGTLLYGVSPRDPVTFAAALVLMIIASALACVLPAWRAMRADPLIALRG
jgi:predicted permease